MTEIEELRNLCAHYRTALASAATTYDRWSAACRDVGVGPGAESTYKDAWRAACDQTVVTRTALAHWLKAHGLGDVLDVV